VCDCSDPDQSVAVILYPSLGTPMLIGASQKKCSLFIASASLGVARSLRHAQPPGGAGIHRCVALDYMAVMSTNKDKHIATPMAFTAAELGSLRCGRLNAAQVLIEGNTIGALDIQQGRIGKLTIVGNTISRSVDFSRTQVGQSTVQSLAAGQAKLDGSNVRLR
jgi:hypothetical protein